jgi:hypothetical protein
MSAGPSHSQQSSDVPNQRNHCKFPSDDPANATALWINQLKYIWGLCKLFGCLYRYYFYFNMIYLLNRPFLPCSVEESAEPSPSTSILCHNPHFSPVNSSSCHHYTDLFDFISI